MIFSLFLRKNQKDSQPFPTTVAVQKFIKSYMGPNDWVLALPGYMSETEKNIDDFVDQIFCSGLNQPITNAYFAEGVNGTHNVKKSTQFPAPQIQAWHNSKFIKACPWSIPNQRDHAKMLIFTDGGPMDDGTAKVKAILLGSSNQSYQTYFYKSADKGEADIFLIEGEYLCPKTTGGENVGGNKENNEDIEEKAAREFYEQIGGNDNKNDNDNENENEGENENKSLIALFEEMAAPRDLLNRIFKEVLKP